MHPLARPRDRRMICQPGHRGYSDWATVGAIVGFALMMVLDVAMG
jgi:hypothetical protein